MVRGKETLLFSLSPNASPCCLTPDFVCIRLGRHGLCLNEALLIMTTSFQSAWSFCHTFPVFSNEKSNWECFLNEIWYIGWWLSCLKWKDTSFSFFPFKMWSKMQIKSHMKDASNTYVGWKLQVPLSLCLPLHSHRHLLNDIDTSFILIDICVHIYVHICVQI